MTASPPISKGSVPGAILLVAGSCIGAGMLGLPVLSGIAGFKPSLFMFFVSWLFMVCTGLLLLEVNLWFKEDVSIITMAGRTLGRTGKAIGWGGFFFLFYALMVAYISASGEMIADFISDLAGDRPAGWVGSIIVSLLFGCCIYMGTSTVDRFNRVLMLGLAVTYVVLITGGLPHIRLSYLMHSEWSASTLVLPAMIISFGFHNLIPSLSTYLRGDTKKLRFTILVGSAIPLLIYVLWEALILGIVPVEGEGGFRQALGQGEMATQALRGVVGNSLVVDAAQLFAFFALVTSFLGVALSFIDFLADGLKVNKDPRGKLLLCMLVLVPPFACALYYPHLFLSALNYAGGFGAVSLFGILPAAMVWAGRYKLNLGNKPLVPGGKAVLVLVIACACGVIALQAIQMIKDIYN